MVISPATSAALCSFGGGGWLSGEFLVLLGSLLIAALLAPVLVAAYIGWLRHRRSGAIRAACRYAGAVLLIYLTLAGAILLWLTLTERHALAERIAADELHAPVRTAAPGTLAKVLTPALWQSLDTRQRYDLGTGLINRLIEGEPAWTASDWDAVATFADMLRVELPKGQMSPHHADELDGLRWYALLGADATAEAELRCGQRSGCLDALRYASNRGDQRVLAQARDLMRQYQPLDAAVRAALERRLAQRRADTSIYGNDSDLDLAWDRVAPGRLAYALQACWLTLPDSGDDSIYARMCQEDLLSLLDQMGAARLCRNGQVPGEDLHALDQWQRSMQTSPPSGYQTRERLLAFTAALPGRCTASSIQLN